MTAAVSRIPEIYLEDLSSDVNEIQAQIVCEEAQPPPQQDDEGEGKSKDKGKKKGKHKHGDGD